MLSVPVVVDSFGLMCSTQFDMALEPFEQLKIAGGIPLLYMPYAFCTSNPNHDSHHFLVVIVHLSYSTLPSSISPHSCSRAVVARPLQH